jgi:hypothetical protein
MGMKKIFALICLTGILSGCVSGQNEEMVGEWLWRGDGGYTIVFNEDGTGERGFAENRGTFTWDTSGRRLRINHDKPVRMVIQNETWTYRFDDNVLHITSRDENDVQYSYLKNTFEPYENLVGTWKWNNSDAHTYVFSANGTGFRGTPRAPERFTWSADRTVLNIFRNDTPHGERRGEMWALKMDGDTFTISPIDDNDDEEDIEVITFSYTKAN